MTLILDNTEVDRVLTMPECVAALERAYRDLAERKAVNRPRTDMYLPAAIPDAQYVFKSMEGGYPGSGVVALRLNSDVIAWTEYAGSIRKDKQPLANGKWVGLILLFSTATGEPLAILPDGVLQRMRVGASNGLGAKYMSRQHAEVYGLLGAGWQAGAQLMAMAAVRSLREVRVYSPNPEHRSAFAAEWSERLGLDVRAVSSARDAVTGAQIVGAATNSIRPVIQPDWLEPGMYLCCVKTTELSPVLGSCDRVVWHTAESKPHNYLVGLGDRMVPAHDPLDVLARIQAGQEVDADAFSRMPDETGSEDVIELKDVIAGHVPGRESESEITAFVNNIGLGLQFAALGALVYQRARERGLGREVPTDWFLEDVHP